MRSSPIATDEVDGRLADRDARATLGALVAVSLGLTAAGPAGLGVGAITLVGTLRVAGLRLRSMARQLRIVTPVLVLATVGRAATVETGLWSVEALVAGLLASGRFVLLIAFALVVSATTRPSDVALAVEWLLRPVPFVRETDWATMFAAAVRFVPLIGEEVGTVRDAQRARLGDERGVVSRLVGLLVATVAGTLRRADALALAMRSRAYRGTRTSRRALRFRRWDAALVVGSVLWAAAVAVL